MRLVLSLILIATSERIFSQDFSAFTPCLSSLGSAGVCIPLVFYKQCPLRFGSALSLGDCTSGNICCSMPSSETGTGTSNDCGIKGIAKSGRITGFNVASGKEFCWNAYLFKNSSTGSEYLGAGVIISETTVITTAKNVQNVQESNLVVLLGDINDENCTQTTGATIQVHPQFQNNISPKTYDIAKLKLTNNAVLDGMCRCKVCLPNANDNFEGKVCTVTGIGSSSSSDFQVSSTLKKVDVPILNNSYCQTLLQKSDSKFTVHQTQLCAGGEANKDACNKDSGGGLFCDRGQGIFTVAGLVSGGYGCGLPNVPGIYTKISPLLGFITA